MAAPDPDPLSSGPLSLDPLSMDDPDPLSSGSLSPEMSPDCGAVELGFVERAAAAAARLLGAQFPSKVGGRPAWLSLELPGPERLRCDGCARPLIFLLQVYAPLERAFHRALLLFCCAAPRCARRRFVALRNQLGRVNDFYPAEPQPEAQASLGPPPGLRLCRVCGALGPNTCSRCRRAHYCGEEHQRADWKAGHRAQCGTAGAAGDDGASTLNVLFPELELVMEREDEQDECGETLAAAGQVCMSEVMEEKVLEAMAKHTTNEVQIFAKFQKRIALAPDQVMPQLLNHLKVDRLGESLDWGTLVVYTCAQSCDPGNAYILEFIWKQDFSAE
ncbi:programmed cell death protein 2 isoform X2 [Rhinoraja longicauda]